MFENRILRLESGGNFHLDFNDNYLDINYSYNNSAKKIRVNLDDFTVLRLGILAYCDELIELSAKKLYRIRKEIIIK